MPASRVVHLVGQNDRYQPTFLKRLYTCWKRDDAIFLKNHGPSDAAKVDGGHDHGPVVLALARPAHGQGRCDPPSPKSGDSIRHSVFMKGFRVTNVKNPALASSNC